MHGPGMTLSQELEVRPGTPEASPRGSGGGLRVLRGETLDVAGLRPCIRSSRIYVIDTKPDPTKSKIHKIIEPEEVFGKTVYSRPHTIHCGPEGIYVSRLAGAGADATNGSPGYSASVGL